MLIAVVVLPSFGIELVTTITRGGLSTARNCKFVRSLRNASAIAELSVSNDIAAVFRRSLSNGMLPTSPVPVISSMVSRSLDGVVEHAAQNRKTDSQQQPHRQADGNIETRFSEPPAFRESIARFSTTTRASGLAPSVRSFQFTYHDDEFVGQRVGNIARPDRRLVKDLYIYQYGIGFCACLDVLL